MIVGLVGFIGSGKGTAGLILNEHGFVMESFAGAVKDVASVMFGWPRKLLEGDTDESRQFREVPDKFWSEKFGHDFTPREALQKLGTEVGRDTFNKDFWVHKLESKIAPWENYVITDVRFPNEINWIHKMHGIVIHVQRGEYPEWYRHLTQVFDERERAEYMKPFGVHQSEWAWVGQDIDAIIHNDGTVADLNKKLLMNLTKFYGNSIMNKHLHNGELNETQ